MLLNKSLITRLLLALMSIIVMAMLSHKTKKNQGKSGRLVLNASTALNGYQNQASCILTEDPEIAQCNVTNRTITTNVGGSNPTRGTSVPDSGCSLAANNTTFGFCDEDE